MIMFNRMFWRDALERAIKSAAQGVLLVLVQDLQPTDQFNIFDASPMTAFGVAAGMGVLSLLTSIISAGVPGTISPASAIHP